MKRAFLSMLVVASCLIAVSAWADWNPGDPAKWVQRPDLTEMGIDVNATFPFILADDFECTETGLITSIHVWGSWLDDAYPFGGDPGAVKFTLSIHADIPAGPGGEYSRPGELLWQANFDPGTFEWRPYAENIMEGWLNPPEEYTFPADWTCWQYNFYFDANNGFTQTGGPDNPIVYWLDVQATPQDPATLFGWKTSVQHWNDDAVWGQGEEPYFGPWFELRYPPGHEQYGQSIDLAFVLVGEEQPPHLDFGDAPDSPQLPGYRTLLVHDGARHVPGGPWFCDAAGADSPDTEADGQPDPNAMGDDLLDGNDDEDGVVLPAIMTQGQPATINFNVCGGGGNVVAWIDWNQDNVWTAAEQIINGNYVDGAHAVNILVPSSAVLGQTFSRFRISQLVAGLPPTGLAQDGEVEDHEVFIEAAPERDFGDAPDGLLTPRYPVYESSDGARHIPGGPWFCDAAGGDFPDTELDGLASGNALGDDGIGVDDEDGVQVPILTQGQQSTIYFNVCGGGGKVTAWIDWDQDEVWTTGERIINSHYPDGAHSFIVTVPTSAAIGQTFSRFRISLLDSVVTLVPTGQAQDGEVEDHTVTIEAAEEDFGDAPDAAGAPGYPTLLVHNGARHTIGGPYLGDRTDGPDPDPDGQPDPNALGDDLADLNDDEDGVTIPAMQQTIPATITYEVNGGGGFVEGWIDWNGDQTWDASELILSGIYADGFHNINVVPPATSITGQTFARFRISTAGVGAPDGPAADGEVEDHEVWIDEGPQTYKWEQPPDLQQTGIDVNATKDWILADDFECTQTGRIIEIHVWGSWLDDYIPWMEDPLSVNFTLSFHADIPAGPNPDEYSRPGNVLWVRNFLPGSFDVELYATDIEEGWMNPPDDYWFPADWTCWLYKFTIPESEAFLQLGTPGDPQVYWLDVQAAPEDTAATFGWKTSYQHWNDDAVYGRGAEPYPGPWGELIYPDNHPFAGDSIDLAFRLFGVQTPVEYDFGDAPDPTFPTLWSSGGAYHVIDWTVFMGNLIDSELNGQPTADASGDDTGGVDDEDGVTFPTDLRPGAPQNVDVVVSVDGYIDAWVDFHGDGSWAAATDQIFASEPVLAGNNTITFTVPPTGMGTQDVITRFRFSTAGGLPYTGGAPDGEVEDYEVTIEDDMTGMHGSLLPQRFELYPAAPNPFNPMATIRFDLPTPQHVKLTVYAVDGSKIATVVSEPMIAGQHEVVWNGRSDAGQPVASGTYFYRIEAGTFTKVLRMTLVK